MARKIRIDRSLLLIMLMSPVTRAAMPAIAKAMPFN
jgi:hypothetical protein